MPKVIVLLISSITTDLIQAQNTSRIEDLFIGKGFAFEKIDGALPENKETRDALFAVEGSQRGKYPQCFIRNDDGSLNFIGLWNKIGMQYIHTRKCSLPFTLFVKFFTEELVECDSLPADILEANPTIPTFSKVFVDAQKV